MVAIASIFGLIGAVNENLNLKTLPNQDSPAPLFSPEWLYVSLKNHPHL